MLRILIIFVSLCAQVFVSGCSDSHSDQKSLENVSENGNALPTGEPVTEQGAAQEQCPESNAVLPENLKIDSFIQYLNVLPKPLTAFCLFHYLPKPLQVNATASKDSVQQATGKTNPRLFFGVGMLHISIALTNTGAARLEVAEIINDTESVKGEIGIPIRGEITPSAMYQRAQLNETATTCGSCHLAERPAGAAYPESAFISQAIRPEPSKDVPLDYLKGLAKACNPQDFGGELRCGILAILAAEGGSIPYEFPPEMSTQFRR